MSASQILAERPVLVFDLDGTLVDSAPDIQHTLLLALGDCGLDAASAEGLLDLHSPLDGIVRSVLAERGEPEALADAVVQAYRRRLAAGSFERCTLYPGVVPFFWQALHRGQRMAVCTNKRQPEALRMLDHFELLKFFEIVVGCESAAYPKPHAAPLEMVLDAIGAKAGDALIVGDTHIDAQCAVNTGVDFVWHRPGYGNVAAVNALPMAASFDSFVALLTAPGHHTNGHARGLTAGLPSPAV